MTIIYPTTRRVKTTSRTFGLGILASRPAYHVDHSLADEAWFAALSEPDFDTLAGEAAAMDRLEAGLCC